MTENEALHLINTTPALQSILYDCGMLPEQQMIEASKQWFRVMAYALAYQAGANDEREACAKVCEGFKLTFNNTTPVDGVGEYMAAQIRMRSNV